MRELKYNYVFMNSIFVPLSRNDILLHCLNLNSYQAHKDKDNKLWQLWCNYTTVVANKLFATVVAELQKEYKLGIINIMDDNQLFKIGEPVFSLSAKGFKPEL
jgi:chromosome condensin MukBEF MukE localization factor